MAGLDEMTLELRYWDASQWVDADCGAYDRHPQENRLAVPVCHLSSFALFGHSEEDERKLYLPIVVKQRSP